MATADVTSVAAPVVPAAPPIVAPPTTATEPGPRLFTVDDYYRMSDAGVFKPGERVELIRGVVIKMNAIGNRHAKCVNRLAELLVFAYAKIAAIHFGNPVRFDDTTEPQPDFAILKLEAKEGKEHPRPGDVLVAIEVSDSSTRYDRNVKAPLYAEAGIPEYWLVDLEAETVEVRRKPNKSGYGELQTLARGEQLRCSAFPEAALDVAAILG